MKKLVPGVIALTFIAICFSCKSGGGGATPTLALKAMAEDAKKGDFKLMVKNMCKKDAEAMNKIISFAETAAKIAGMDIKDVLKKQMEKNNQFNFNDVEFKNEKIDGDKASVDVLKKGETQAQTINFIKEGGNWKICMGIADKMDDAFNQGGLDKLSDPKTMKDGMDKLNTPEFQKQMQEAMKNVKPEDLEKMKDLFKNVKPEDMEKAKEAMQKMMQH
jgi:hypothetical protein